MTWHLVAVAKEGTRTPLSRIEHTDWWTQRRRMVDADEAHRMSRKRAMREASEMNGWESVRKRGFRIVAEPVAP